MHLQAQKHRPFSNPSHNNVCQTASRSASYRRTPRNACLQPQESRERCRQIFVSAACLGAAKIFRDNWGISHKKVVFTICTEHPTPTIQKFSHRLACVFLIEFSLSGWANCKRGEYLEGKVMCAVNTSIACFSCGEGNVWVNYNKTLGVEDAEHENHRASWS